MRTALIGYSGNATTLSIANGVAVLNTAKRPGVGYVNNRMFMRKYVQYSFHEDVYLVPCAFANSKRSENLFQAHMARMMRLLNTYGPRVEVQAVYISDINASADVDMDGGDSDG